MALRTSRLVVAALGAACTGPSLHVDNPGDHPFFVDGVEAKAGTRSFRYYGTTRVDALPADGKDRMARPDWSHRPTSQMVEVPHPATPWLFPLDLPLELLSRVFHGRGDVTAVVGVEPSATPPSTATETSNLELAAMAERARTARISR